MCGRGKKRNMKTIKSSGQEPQVKKKKIQRKQMDQYSLKVLVWSQPLREVKHHDAINMRVKMCGIAKRRNLNTTKTAVVYPKVTAPKCRSRAPRLPMDAPKLPMDVSKLPMDAPKLPMDVSKLPLDAPMLPMDEPKLPMDAPKLTMDVSKLTMDVSKLTMDAPKLPVDAPKLLVDEPELPVDEPELPVDEPELPVDEPVLPVDEPVLRVDEPVLRVDEPVLRVDEPVLPVDEPVLPVDEPVLPVDEPVLRVDEPVLSVDEPVLSVDEPVLSVDEPVLPVDEPVLPVDEPVLPVDEPVLPVDEPVLRVDEPVLPVDEPVLPVDEPVLRVDEPVLRVDEPVLSVDEPVLSVDEPVLSVDEPVLPVDEPVLPVGASELYMGAVELPVSAPEFYMDALELPVGAPELYMGAPENTNSPSQSNLITFNGEDIGENNVQPKSDLVQDFDNEESIIIPKRAVKLLDGRIGFYREDVLVELGIAKRQERKKKKKCPECGVKRIELPSHMRVKHGYSKEKASKINMITNQRAHNSKTYKGVLKRERQQCPQCSSKPLNLGVHLKRIHNKKNVIIPTKSACQKNENPVIELDSSNVTIRESVSLAELEPSLDEQVTTVSNDKDHRDSIESAILRAVESSNVLPLNSMSADYVVPDLLKKALKEYGEWMMGPQGGGNKKVTASQNREMMTRVCHDLNAQCVSDIVDDSKLWRLMLGKKNEKKWSGHTSRSYMVAIKKFLMFLLKDKRKQNYTTEEDRDLARDIITDIGNWSKSYRNQIGIEGARKRIKHAQNLIDPDKFNHYKGSEEFKNALLLFQEMRNGIFELNRKRFSLLRGFLLFNVNLRNANRAGVLAELTTENFKNYKKGWDRTKGCSQYIVTIEEHKTLATSGPAKLTFSTQLFEQMDLYLNHVRSEIAVEENGYFFTSYKGKPMLSSSSVAHYLSRHTEASGIGHMTSNDFRRSATTITRLVDPTMKNQVAGHLNHHIATAEKVYNVVNKDLQGFEATQFLQDIYDGKLEKTSKVEFTSDVPGEAQASSSMCAAMEKEFLTSQDCEDTDQLEEFAEMKSQSKQRTFLDSDKNRIHDLFWSELLAGNTYTSSEIDVICKENIPELFQKYGQVRLRNKFRYLKATYLHKKENNKL